jgi:transcriptional regulator with XRE-family HTH domain
MNRIRELREAKALTQEQVATAAGTDKTMIGRLEKGERRLTQQWMERIAPALGVSPAALIDPRGPSSLGPAMATDGRDGVRLSINRLVTHDQAARIFAILAEKQETQ